MLTKAAGSSIEAGGVERLTDFSKNKKTVLNVYAYSDGLLLLSHMS